MSDAESLEREVESLRERVRELEDALETHTDYSLGTQRWPDEPQTVTCQSCGEPFDVTVSNALQCPHCGTLQSDDSEGTDGADVVGTMEVSDDFIQTYAVPAEDAESWVLIELDDHFHPTGGYWVPTGKEWGDATGWVASKDDIKRGDLIQYPCDDRLPEIVGRDELPDWVVDRVVGGDA